MIIDIFPSVFIAFMEKQILEDLTVRSGSVSNPAFIFLIYLIASFCISSNIDS